MLHCVLISFSWKEFSDVHAFKIPQQVDYTRRLQVNLQYYMANYIAVVVGHLLVVCFNRPLFLHVLTFILVTAVYLFNVRTYVTG
jgi:hypothetical protein